MLPDWEWFLGYDHLVITSGFTLLRCVNQFPIVLCSDLRPESKSTVKDHSLKVESAANY